MKKVLVKLSVILMFVFIFTGCTKDYKKLSYTTYDEYFNNKTGYKTIDHSSERGTEIIRDLEAGNGTIQIMYLEFKTEDYANDYIKEYFDASSYKKKVKDDVTIIKNTNDKYFKLYKIDNVIVYGLSSEKKDKGEINKILKDLGY
jgi:hypothetical protein